MSKKSLHKVLIADDSRIFRAVVRDLFDDIGITVLEAESGTQALSMIHSQRPDLVLLDVLMPGLDGLQVARSLEGSDLEPKPLILLTTGIYKSPQQRQELLATHQVAGFLTKPIKPEDLQTAVEEHFELGAVRPEVAAAEAPPQEPPAPTPHPESTPTPTQPATTSTKPPSTSADETVDDLLASVGLDPESLRR